MRTTTRQVAHEAIERKTRLKITKKKCVIKKVNKQTNSLLKIVIKANMFYFVLSSWLLSI